MDILCPCVRDIGKWLYDTQIKHHVGYIIYCERHVTTLVKELEDLKAMGINVTHRVEIAQRTGEDVREDVHKWLENVEITKEEISKMGDRVNDIKGVMGRLKNFKLYYKLGEEAVKMIATVEELQKKDLSDISQPPNSPNTKDYIPIGDFMPFNSTSKCMNDILDALKDVKNQIICVYGMSGVGKTTLIRQVGRKTEEERIVDKSVMVIVSKDVNVNRIQTEIYMNLVHKKLEVEEEFERAAKLSSTLKKTSSILIILDDFWNSLDLSQVGIPFGSDHKGCKIIITTWENKVCNFKDSQKDFLVSVLSPEESLVLFKSKAGEVVDKLEKTLIMDVVKECRGLPLALTTLGGALRGKPPNAWKRALEKLRRADTSGIRDMKEKVFESLKLSFEFLENEEIKLCFLE